MWGLSSRRRVGEGAEAKEAKELVKEAKEVKEVKEVRDFAASMVFDVLIVVLRDVEFRNARRVV